MERFPSVKKYEKKFLEEQEKREAENFERSKEIIQELEELKEQTPSWKEVPDLMDSVPRGRRITDEEYNQMSKSFGNSMRNTRFWAHLAGGRPINYFQGAPSTPGFWTRHNVHLDTHDTILGEYEGRYRRQDLFSVIQLRPGEPYRKNVWFW